MLFLLSLTLRASNALRPYLVCLDPHSLLSLALRRARKMKRSHLNRRQSRRPRSLLFLPRARAKNAKCQMDPFLFLIFKYVVYAQIKPLALVDPEIVYLFQTRSMSSLTLRFALRHNIWIWTAAGCTRTRFCWENCRITYKMSGQRCVRGM
jgi:hypothetical protein